jgi:outer membrane protein assembly factor BamB
MRLITLIFTFWFLGLSNLSSQVISEFRGIGRTGVYNETGLLKEWPEAGPKLLWSIENLPKGFSSVAIANNMIYTTGNQGDNDVLVAMDMNGVIKWQTPYGRGWTTNFPESRCTPTIEGDRIYVSSGIGDVTCINAISGEVKWTVKARDEYRWYR